MTGWTDEQADQIGRWIAADLARRRSFAQNVRLLANQQREIAEWNRRARTLRRSGKRRDARDCVNIATMYRSAQRDLLMSMKIEGAVQ